VETRQGGRSLAEPYELQIFPTGPFRRPHCFDPRASFDAWRGRVRPRLAHMLEAQEGLAA